MKVLLTAVGRRDPYPVDAGGQPNRTSPGAILQGVNRVQPDAVYLLPTAEGQEHTLEQGQATKRELEEQGLQNVHLIPLALPDPTDYRAVVAEFRRAIRALREQHDEATTEWHILLSSGAPQFRLAWGLIVLNGDCPARCWEIRDPRYPGEPAWEADIRFLNGPGLRHRFERAWHASDFASAREAAREWERQASTPEHRRAAAWVAGLLYAYMSWDEVNWPGAAQELRRAIKAGRSLPISQGLAQSLHSQASALAAIQSLPPGREGFWNLADLYHNARRRLRAGMYVDALSRYRRIVEGTLYAALRNHGCDIERRNRGYAVLPDDVEVILHDAKAKGSSISIRRNVAGHVYLDLPAMFLLVRGLMDIDERTTDRLQGFADQRNQTIAAHGMERVRRETAVEALDAVAAFMESTLSGPIALESYPFGVTALDSSLRDVLSLLDLPD
jgi:hypothetical protein